jgi:hypothetical protein
LHDAAEPDQRRIADGVGDFLIKTGDGGRHKRSLVGKGGSKRDSFSRAAGLAGEKKLD